MVGGENVRTSRKRRSNIRDIRESRLSRTSRDWSVLP